MGQAVILTAMRAKAAARKRRRSSLWSVIIIIRIIISLTPVSMSNDIIGGVPCYPFILYTIYFFKLKRLVLIISFNYFFCGCNNNNHVI